jgi:hypothetical protein
MLSYCMIVSMEDRSQNDGKFDTSKRLRGHSLALRA